MSPRLAAPVTALLLAALAACAPITAGSEGDIDTTERPEKGACRVLTPEDIMQSSNASEVVACSEEHTAETFAVGTFPKKLARSKNPEDADLGAHIYKTCDKKFRAFVGGEESAVMRSTVTWAWFRPSDAAWDKGARWYRCDVVGGGEQSQEFVPLPESAKGLLSGEPEDEWMTCADGETIAGSVKVPCSEPHTWRAVTTIKLGDPEDPYPGDDMVEVRTRDFCSDSVRAWMNYPVDFDFGYTYFHEAEWKTGNRRSICWARTDQ